VPRPISWPCSAGRWPPGGYAPNPWYGLRVPATFADPQVWYDANALAGRDLMVFGAGLAVVSLALPRVVSLSETAYGGVCAALLGLGALGTTVRGWRAANRLLRERRASGAG
jgi:hypothetical protein